MAAHRVAARRGGADQILLSSLPPRTALKRLVHTAKARWVIERDYQDLKQEIGLGHYEGRNWRGFHHHASLAIAAYGFLMAERCVFPPQHRFAPARTHRPALPQGSSPVAPPIRPERHVPHSIASVRRRLTVTLISSLPRCPCCLQKYPHVKIKR